MLPNGFVFRFIPLLLGLSAVTCTSPYYLTLVSPGITSESRLTKQTDLRMEEASFYGSWAYSHTAFYIDQTQLPKVLDDPNNAVFQPKEMFLLKESSDTQSHILFEYCYDKTKPIAIEKDMKNYRFQLNGEDPIENLVYLYPYSYSKKGKVFRKRFPFYERLAHPNDKILITNGFDQLYCVRTLLSFDKTKEKQGLNRFTVTTPRNQHLFYEYEMREKFVTFKEEEIN
ncbi:hypothetical protein [Leptospira jelokensis]|uniref:hypothetical protein n=1 Tax=Leptospira jelokensis TaxID=2484931 RepID=UPI001FC9385A|nr:hypothetical protein [Leptospira jelokensis]